MRVLLHIWAFVCPSTALRHDPIGLVLTHYTILPLCSWVSVWNASSKHRLSLHHVMGRTHLFAKAISQQSLGRQQNLAHSLQAINIEDLGAADSHRQPVLEPKTGRRQEQIDRAARRAQLRRRSALLNPAIPLLAVHSGSPGLSNDFPYTKRRKRRSLKRRSLDDDEAPSPTHSVYYTPRGDDENPNGRSVQEHLSTVIRHLSPSPDPSSSSSSSSSHAVSRTQAVRLLLAEDAKNPTLDAQKHLSAGSSRPQTSELYQQLSGSSKSSKSIGVSLDTFTTAFSSGCFPKVEGHSQSSTPPRRQHIHNDLLTNLVSRDRFDIDLPKPRSHHGPGLLAKAETGPSSPQKGGHVHEWLESNKALHLEQKQKHDASQRKSQQPFFTLRSSQRSMSEAVRPPSLQQTNVKIPPHKERFRMPPLRPDPKEYTPRKQGDRRRAGGGLQGDRNISGVTTIAGLRGSHSQDISNQILSSRPEGTSSVAPMIPFNIRFPNANVNTGRKDSILKEQWESNTW